MKQRLDILLVDKGLFPSRTSAQAAIMAGEVNVSGQIINKASTQVDTEAQIQIKDSYRYVSRGAYKLERAIQEFKLDVKGKIAVDVGTATGGFAQVLLEHDVEKVIAIDVGYGQFSYKLRQDSRIDLYERTNIRYFDSLKVEKSDLAVADLSFISITRVIDNILSLLKDNAELIILIKPQFETNPRLAKKGVVKDRQVHYEVLLEVLSRLQDKGLHIAGLTYSPIKGPKGNIEFLAYLKRKGKSINYLESVIHKIIEEAHEFLC